MTAMTFMPRLAEGLQRLRNGQGLRFQLARGSLWLGMSSGVDNALRTVRNMILARLLAPESFGMMAIILAVNSAFEALTEVGIREAVVQNQGGGRRAFLNAAWWMAALRGLGLYLCAWLAAPWAAAFYHAPDLVPMMRVAFLAILFNGLISPRTFAALKRMRYRPLVIIQQAGSFLGIATSIVLGLVLRNVWALAIGFAVEAIVRCLLSFVCCPFRPRLNLDRPGLRALLVYAGGMAGMPLLTMLYAKIDIFVIGRLCPPEQLGVYSMATALAFIPDTLCSTVLAPLLMPALSTMQADPERMLHNLLRTMKLLALLFLPPLTLMGCAAPLLLRLVYGEAYVIASLAFTLFCANVAVRALGWGLVTVFFAIGRPALSRQVSALRLAVLLVIIVPLVQRMGPAGAALACLLSALAWVGLSLFHLRRLFGLGLGRYFAAVRTALAVSVLIAGVWTGAAYLMR